MAAAHTLAEMREQILLWLTLTFAKKRAPKHTCKRFKGSGELGISS